MQSATEETFDVLVKLLREVKPGLGDRTVRPEDSVVDDLGLDSLDILQLSRKIQRHIGGSFDLDEWSEDADGHNRTVASILEHIGNRVDA